MLLQLFARAASSDRLMRIANPLFGLWNPFLASHRRDPYPTYRRLRERAPRYHHRLMQSWVFTRHADVETVLTDPRMSAERGDSDLFRKYLPLAGASPRLRDVFMRSLLMLDPPDHTRVRGLVNTAFTPRATERLTRRIETLVDGTLGPLEREPSFDFVERFAVPVPLVVICELLGIPTDRLGDLKRWSEMLTRLLDPVGIVDVLHGSQRSFAELATYLDGLVAARRAAPGTDLLSALVQAEEAGDRLGDAELTSLVALLLAAGHETTTNLLSNSLLALEDRPDLRRRLVEEPGVVDAAVDELLRFDGPVQLTDRFAKEETRVGDATVKRGQMAIVLLAAANRDPEVFERPDTLDFDRPRRRHLAFGHGAHFCVGAALARLEARVALPALMARLGDYRIDREGLEWKRSVVLRGPERLVVRPASAGPSRA